MISSQGVKAAVELMIRSRIGVVMFAMVAAGLVFTTSPSLAQDFDAVEIRTTDLGGGVHMFTGRGGNIGVSVGSDGVILIDDQFAG